MSLTDTGFMLQSAILKTDLIQFEHYTDCDEGYIEATVMHKRPTNAPLTEKGDIVTFKSRKLEYLVQLITDDLKKREL